MTLLPRAARGQGLLERPPVGSLPASRVGLDRSESYPMVPVGVTQRWSPGRRRASGWRILKSMQEISWGRVQHSKGCAPQLRRRTKFGMIFGE